ncbi:MAG: hypothetical protein ACRC24_03665 [Vibrionaceae bacterium]
MPNINQSFSQQQRQRTGVFDRQPQNTRQTRHLQRALRHARITQRAQAQPQTLTQESQGLAAQAGEATQQSQCWLQGGIVARQARGPTSIAARVLFGMVLLNMIRPVGGTDTPPTTSNSDETSTNADSSITQANDATSADSSGTTPPTQATQHHSEVLHADSFVAASRHLISNPDGQVQATMRFRNRACLRRVLATIYEEETPSTAPSLTEPTTTSSVPTTITDPATTTEQATTDVTENSDSTATSETTQFSHSSTATSLPTTATDDDLSVTTDDQQTDTASITPTEEPTTATPTGLPTVSERHINWQSQDGNVVSGTLTRDQFELLLAEAATNDDNCLVSASVDTISLPEVAGEIARQAAFDDAVTALRAALGAGTQVCTSTGRVVAQVSDTGGGYDQAEEVECVPVATHYAPPSSNLTNSTLGLQVAEICPDRLAIISDGIQATDVANNVESRLTLGSPVVTGNGVSQVISTPAPSSLPSASTTTDGNSSFTSMVGNATSAESGNFTTQQTSSTWQDTSTQSNTTTATTRLTTEENGSQQPELPSAETASGNATNSSTLGDQLARSLLIRCPNLRLTSLQATQQPSASTNTGHRARRDAEETIKEGAVGGSPSPRVMSATDILQMLEFVWRQADMDGENAPQIVMIAEVQEVASYHPDFTEIANLTASLQAQGIVVIAYAATENSWLSRVPGVRVSYSLSEVLTLIDPDPPVNNTEPNIDWSVFNSVVYYEDESDYGFFDATDGEEPSSPDAGDFITLGIGAAALVATLASIGLAFYCWGRRSRQSSLNTLSPPDLDHESDTDPAESDALLGSAIELQVMGESDTDPAEGGALLSSEIELQFMGESALSSEDLYQRMTRRLSAASVQNSSAAEQSEPEPLQMLRPLLRFASDDDSDNDASSTSRRPSLVLASNDAQSKKQGDHAE